jgi:hypothetical protein
VFLELISLVYRLRTTRELAPGVEGCRVFEFNLVSCAGVFLALISLVYRLRITRELAPGVEG